jgi:hypothetical protein
MNLRPCLKSPKRLGLAVPSVFTHVRDMLASELVREAVEWEKLHPAELWVAINTSKGN